MMKALKDYLNKKIRAANDKTKTKKAKTIHTSRHALAEEIAEYFNEIKDYKKYLGVCYQHSEEEIRRLFSEIKEEEKRNPNISAVKLFFWKLKQLPPKKKSKKKNGKSLSKRK